MRVVIADDSALIRDRLVDSLAELDGVDIVARAEDGSQAIEKTGALAPDVLILDLHMPEVNGLEVLKTIKSFADPPLVIVLTAFASARVRRECETLGAEFFLDKTSDFDQVSLALKTLLEADFQPKDITKSSQPSIR